ncbi:hypothetical protein TcWFU_009518 [Taenia crassiceps]|uniref:Uncharacterized protein n=1 Tax=Taenia crassiceps TaxID=6207 RepID=A0ABR4Q5H4_9CEST
MPSHSLSPPPPPAANPPSHHQPAASRHLSPPYTASLTHSHFDNSSAPFNHQHPCSRSEGQSLTFVTCIPLVGLLISSHDHLQPPPQRALQPHCASIDRGLPISTKDALVHRTYKPKAKKRLQFIAVKA